MTIRVFIHSKCCKCGNPAGHSVPWTRERAEDSRRKAEEKRAERERKKRESMSLREINERLAEAARPLTQRETMMAIFEGVLNHPVDVPWPHDWYCDECWRNP